MKNPPSHAIPRHMRSLPAPGVAGIVSICLLVVFMAAPSAAWAEVFTATHTHVVGDEESRNDAREACRQEARRTILERIGTYTESLSATEDFQLSKDEIRSFASAMLSVQQVEESWNVDGGALTLTCTMTAEADMAEARKRMEEQGRQVIARERFREWREEIRKDGVRSQGPGGPLSGPGLAESGNDALTSEMVEQEAESMADERERMTRLAERVAVKGMTLAEADRLLGKPGAMLAGENTYCALYGTVWYVFQQGRLTCVRTRLSPGAHGEQCDCAGFGMDFILR
ncbi:hypothetical protein DPQ33_05410 [Oceanidesulfovibrio indonesiensis]|uniref:Uncharacterized protein n=1 Tax=Oceanidesulfovibrio indonesiensis TaxID=54767 RepID=A0A7M3MHC5_9BACT|nr:hypothetical protein [Oceanidesulfovibrio indonesiensis]TVM18896.1 hypothetical protein DPQ33_05410 [Oceanidesulfovibrio indonesiensis]